MSMHFWKHFYNLKQVDSDSDMIMENILEITVFILFDNLPLNIG